MAWAIRLRDGEACDPTTPFLSPDLVIVEADGATVGFDYVLAGTDETRNRGGFSAKRGLHTAVAIQLFSDRRWIEGQDILDERDPDRRGWWGDSVDLQPGEDEIGSWLWTLRRSDLTPETLAKAREYALLALQPLVDQGAVVRFEVECQGLRGTPIDPTAGVLVIKVDGYGRDGSKIYATRFEALWKQIEAMRR